MSTAISVSALADEVRASDARLAAIEAQLGQLLEMTAEEQERMKARFKLLAASTKGFSLAYMLETILFYLEREFGD